MAKAFCQETAELQTSLRGVLIGAGFAKQISLFDPLGQIAEMKDAAPGAIDPHSGLPYLFGGDKLARDVFSRVIAGARIVLIIAPLATLLALSLGGARGANIALMVEVLSAGLTGANWSLDAPSFETGNRSPGTGLFVAVFAPGVLAPDFSTRLGRQTERLAGLGVHIPGRGGRRLDSTRPGLELPASLVAEVERACIRANEP